MTLKKIPEPPITRLKLPAARLYLDDLEWIYDKVRGRGEVALEADGHAADAVGDLTALEKRGHVKKVTISTDKFSDDGYLALAVELSSDWWSKSVAISGSPTNPRFGDCQARMFEIHRYVSDRRRWPWPARYALAILVMVGVETMVSTVGRV